MIIHQRGSKMIKFLLTSTLFFSTTVRAWGTDSVMNCNAKIEIDQGQYDEVGIRVLAKYPGFVSFLTGSGEPGPIATTLQVVALRDSLKIYGVQQILSKTNIPRNTQQRIHSVRIYTAGNFDDDLAGVRAAQFLDRNHKLLGSGMFFGWAGPVKCL